MRIARAHQRESFIRNSIMQNAHPTVLSGSNVVDNDM